MALSGNYLTVTLQQHSSGTANEAVAESTSANISFTADAYETTNHAFDDLSSRFIGGIVTGEVTGDYLLASDGEQFNQLFAHMNNADIVNVDFFRSGSRFIQGTGIISALDMSASNSDSLVTGSYSIRFVTFSLVSASYGTEYQAIIDSFTTPPDTDVASAQNTMIETLVSAGVWAKLDIFYMFAQQYNTDSEALVNWINPGTYDATAFNSPTFTSLEGYTGNGSNAYIDTNYNPTSHATNYGLNSASAGAYSRTDVAEYSIDMYAATQASVYLRSGTNRGAARVNDTANAYWNSIGDSLGMYVSNRPDAAYTELWKNSVRGVNAAKVPAAIPNSNFWVFRGGSSYSSRQISMAFAGGGLTQTDIENITDAFETYMDSNGKGVIT